MSRVLYREANEVLANGFVEDLNRRFSVAPVEPGDAHVRIPKTVDLRTIFCFESLRVVNNDWVVRYDNRFFQLLQHKRMRVRPHCKVTIAEWLDKSIHILYENREIPYEEITTDVLKAAKRKVS